MWPQIAVQSQPGKYEFARQMPRRKLLLQGNGIRPRYLVLNRDVQPRRMPVLPGQDPMKMIRDPFPDDQHGRTGNGQRRSLPQIHQAIDPGGWWRMFPRHTRKETTQLIPQGWREGMKQSDMRLKPVAFRGKMLAAQAICPSKNFRREFRRYNEGAGLSDRPRPTTRPAPCGSQTIFRHWHYVRQALPQRHVHRSRPRPYKARQSSQG